MHVENWKTLIPCRTCPLRLSEAFAPANRSELAAIQKYKTDHLRFAAGRDVLPRVPNGHFYTLLSGWAFRYALVDGGARQILNFLLPGDIIGLESVFNTPVRYGVMSMTAVELCAFPSSGFTSFAQENPRLGFEMARLSFVAAGHADRRLTALGRRPANARTAALFVELHDRLADRGMIDGSEISVPVTHEQLADALGLTSVYISRTLQLLDHEGLAHFEKGTLVIHNLPGLRLLAGASDGANDGAANVSRARLPLL
jgi:CRP/FNR family transcriptional regulator, anaerobic regulatory protein